jgi:hypothetical protein
VPLDALNNGTFTGTVTLTPTTGLPVNIPVTLNVVRTQVNYVAPYVGQSGVGADVIIRGDNFSLITPTGVRFGANAATTFNVVSNTEIRATHAPLVAGSYDVHIDNNNGIDRTRARLQVLDAPTFAEAALSYPNGPGVFVSNLVYDAERRALFATIHYGMQGVVSGRLLRWNFTSTWEPTVVTPQFVFPSAIALSTDGTQLLVAHHDPLFQKFAVAELNPVTLGENRMTRFTQDYEASSMAVSNNGEAIIIGDLLCCTGTFPIFGYSPLTGVLRQPPQPGPFGVTDAFATGSGDGSLLLVPNDNEPIGGPRTLRYNSDSGELAENPVSLRARFKPLLSRDGSKVLFLDPLRVYDAGLTLLGTLPTSTLTAALAPSGLRAYAYDNSTNTVHVFNLSVAPPMAGDYPEILPAITLTNNPGSAWPMVISPDGGTLFIGGSDAIVVVPLP